MSLVNREAAHCDDCQHEWLFTELPKRCAKCKSRTWNAPVRPLMTKKTEELIDQVMAKIPASRPTAAAVTMGRPQHDPKTCRVYRCGLCASIATAV